MTLFSYIWYVVTLKDIYNRNDEWRAMAVSLGARGEEVDDVIQNMYLKLAEYLHRDGHLERVQNPKDKNKINTMYIFKMVNSCYIDQHRKRKMLPEEYGVELVHRDRPVDLEELKLQKVMDKLKEAVGMLDDYEHRILELHFVYGYSYRQLEKQIGINYNTLFQTVKRIKGKLKPHLEAVRNDYVEEKETTKEIKGIRGYH